MSALKKIISRKGLSRRELAERSGLSLHTINAHCSGQRRIGMQAAAKYTSILDCSAEELRPDIYGDKYTEVEK